MVVLIPIGITLYLTLFIIKLSTNLIPKEINPNNYLPFDVPGLEILIALIIITFVGWISLSFLGKKFFEIFNRILKKIPILRTIYSAIGQMTESFTKDDNTVRVGYACTSIGIGTDIIYEHIKIPKLDGGEIDYPEFYGSLKGKLLKINGILGSW